MTRSREERDARRQYFAIWSNKFAYALEVYPEEIDSFLRDFKKFKHIYPNFSGPYPTAEEAMQVAKSRKMNGYKAKTYALACRNLVPAFPQRPHHHF